MRSVGFVDCHIALVLRVMGSNTLRRYVFPLLEKQKRRDDALIKTYTDVLEIDAARDRNIALPFQAIEGLKVQREKVMESLNVLASQAVADCAVAGRFRCYPQRVDHATFRLGS